MPKAEYDVEHLPTPCIVCGIDTLDGSKYCSSACECYDNQYWDDVQAQYITEMLEDLE